MAQDRFDWTLVKSFLAVLDAGSLMAAARQSGARQPTLSRHIAELEAQLQVALFERTGRGLKPTAAALAMAEAAREMDAGAQRLARAVAGRQQETTGTVRLSCSQVVACDLLPPVLVALQAEAPGIQVELVASNALSNLLRRDADIAVRMLRPTQTSLVARKLADLRIVACAHRSYLQRTGFPQRPEELLSHRLVGYDRDETVLQGFARMGLPVRSEHFALRTDDQVAYGRLVASGAGIGFMAEFSRRQWPDVLPVLPQLQLPTMPCWLVVHREIRGNRLVRRVYDHLAQALPQALDGA